MWSLIRAFFLKGGTLEEGIKLFVKTNKGLTKSDGQKLINIYQDVQKNTGKVIKFPEDRITPFYKPRPTEEELLEAKYRKLSSLSPEEVKVEMKKEGLTPVEEKPFQGFTPKIVPKDKTLLKDSPEAIAKIKAENKAAIERLKAKK